MRFYHNPVTTLEDATRNFEQLEQILPDHISSGTGAPNKVNPGKGDYYFRTDTPSTGNQRIYVCTVGGASPTWVGIL